jgi:hypothetical protein
MVLRQQERTRWGKVAVDAVSRRFLLLSSATVGGEKA